MEGASQLDLDEKNRVFWDELCGSGLARSIGITEVTADSLARFDEVYMGFYPYLQGYLDRLAPEGRNVLEIGLGFGTVGAILARQAGRYTGVDIAEGPVGMMNDRIRQLGIENCARAEEASVLALPFDGDVFDAVVSIGCLHHTGDLRRAVSEVRRVLRPGGRALVMLYNRHSFRQLVQMRLVRARRRRAERDLKEAVRGEYDSNAAGEAAPHTDFTSRREIGHLFGDFSAVHVRAENFDTYAFRLMRRSVVIQRERLLGTVAHVLGLDLYVTATK